MSNLSALPIGTVLADDYRIEGILGQGGFGITYLGIETMFGRKVAIKEYYPRECAARDSGKTVRPSGTQEDVDHFKWGLDAFEKEAKLLARFDDPHIVGVQRFFKANGTAYFVMDYCDGQPLDEIIRRDGALTLEQLQGIIYPILNSLERIHKEDFLHRDIKPANIFIRSDGSPVLLDFGAARQENVSHSRSVTSLATDGYAAIEQYDAKGRQGPYSDIYGFAATLYRVVTDIKPAPASARILNDALEPAQQLAAGKYPAYILEAIDRGLAVRPELRPSTIPEWRTLFLKGKDQSPGPVIKTKIPDEPKAKKTVNIPDGKAPPKPNKMPLFIGAGAVVLLLIIASQWKSSNSTGNNAAAPAAPGPVLLPTINQDAIILKEIEGSWSESPSTCGFSTRDFVVGSSSNEFVIRSDGKSYRRKITSTQKLDAFTYVVFSSPVSSASESFEEHYRWASGTLRLMKRVVTPSNDLVKVFNGKNFQDGMNTPTLVKCN
jgi:serine/threonine protein kinase